MRLSISLFLSEFIILCCRCNFIYTKPLVGLYVTEISSNQNTYVASLKRVNDSNLTPETDHFCSGILISNQDILTTHHCINKEENNAIQVMLGSTDIRNAIPFFIYWMTSYDQWISMKKLTPEFKLNDIAIIRLIRTVPDDIRPANLAPVSNLFEKKVILNGWSRTNDHPTSRYLKSAVVNILKNKNCQKKIHKVTYQKVEIFPNTLCSSAEPYVITTDGDSGGPVIYQNQVVGIHRGFCPILAASRFDLQVNIHHTIEYYIIFIRDVIHNYV